MLLGKKLKTGNKVIGQTYSDGKIPTMLQMVDETICNILFHQKVCGKVLCCWYRFFSKK